MTVSVLLLAGLMSVAGLATDTLSPEEMIEIAVSFREARDSGDYDTARKFLAVDARMWYEEKSGDGRPIVLGAGPYKQWDEHFGSETSIGPWQSEGNAIWTTVTENNDYYRLLERQDTTRYRLTFYFNDEGLITGYMVSAADANGLNSQRVDRYREFAEWAKRHYPDEWEYLRPNGTFDPAGDRAVRTRELLNKWRESVGLNPIW
ncbi:MAG: hypothetical protein Kow0074_12700 [Candidatus Zixiibacteriota bacterium]